MTFLTYKQVRNSKVKSNDLLTGIRGAKEGIIALAGRSRVQNNFEKYNN